MKTKYPKLQWVDCELPVLVIYEYARRKAILRLYLAGLTEPSEENIQEKMELPTGRDADLKWYGDSSPVDKTMLIEVFRFLGNYHRDTMFKTRMLHNMNDPAYIKKLLSLEEDVAKAFDDCVMYALRHPDNRDLYDKYLDKYKGSGNACGELSLTEETGLALVEKCTLLPPVEHSNSRWAKFKRAWQRAWKEFNTPDLSRY